MKLSGLLQSSREAMGFANFTLCEELVPLKTSLLANVKLAYGMVNFCNFGGLKSVLKFHIFIF